MPRIREYDHRADCEAGTIGHRAVASDVIRHALLLVSVFAAATVQGGEITLESKVARTHLLELFTSQGCSSCPAAEAWLSNLKNESRLWQDFVPLAFHVDYWDHLGWRDPFASGKWTERQAVYSAHWKTDSVFTPAFVLDGVIWRNSAVPSASTEAQGVLKVIIKGERLAASFKPATSAGQRFDIHVARLGFALATDVTAGENSGRKLMQDFVVLGLSNEAMRGGLKEMPLPPLSTQPAPGSRSAIAAWVTLADKLEPIQAVGGWLPEEKL
jgi:hypothetical protein